LNLENNLIIWVKVTKPVSFKMKKISYNGDEAGIEAGSSYKKSRSPDHGKFEYPVSIDESRYELRQRQTLILYGFRRFFPGEPEQER
jgi:hypothetical protein